MKRLVIVQETGFQSGSKGWPETHISQVIPFDDLEFAKEELHLLNSNTDLPYYLFWAEIKIDLKDEVK
jgi:hypothetical protein